MGSNLGDDTLLPRRPVAIIVEKSAGLLDDRADMRFSGDIDFRQSPDRQIGRVVELQPAVTAVDGDALEEMVEGRAPHLGQRIARALERQAVGYVVIDEGQPAKWMRRYRQQQGAAVRQMHQL